LIFKVKAFKARMPSYWNWSPRQSADSSLQRVIYILCSADLGDFHRICQENLEAKGFFITPARAALFCSYSFFSWELRFLSWPMSRWTQVNCTAKGYDVGFNQTEVQNYYQLYATKKGNRVQVRVYLLAHEFPPGVHHDWYVDLSPLGASTTRKFMLRRAIFTIINEAYPINNLRFCILGVASFQVVALIIFTTLDLEAGKERVNIAREVEVEGGSSLTAKFCLMLTIWFFSLWAPCCLSRFVL